MVETKSYCAHGHFPYDCLIMGCEHHFTNKEFKERMSEPKHDPLVKINGTWHKSSVEPTTTLNQLAAEAHRIAVEHGFIDSTIGEDMALIHSEVSEALEDHRNGHKPTETWYESKTSIESKSPIDKPCGIPSEMADVVIRVAHFCAKHGIDLGKAVAEKMEYNATRPYKHGKVM